ncbi:MAG: hypothetical protein QNK23_05280 [Crocinitomicaceae bacterium]|nr:hypothetical protein [Crocinitomicaceae bacterium]
MKISVFILISALANLSFGQIDTLASFFNVLPSEFQDNVYLIDNCTNADEYERAKIILDGDGYHFYSDQGYVGITILKFDSDVYLGFRSSTIDTFSLSDKSCIVFANPFP